MDWSSRAPRFAASDWRGDVMYTNKRVSCVLILLAFILGAFALPASAQSSVTARYDTRIWNASFQSVIAEVPRGTVLTVVGTRGEWVEVEVPGKPGAARVTGFAFASSLEGLGVNAREPAAGAPTATTSPAPVTAPVDTKSRFVSFRGFGQFGTPRLWRATASAPCSTIPAG